MSRLSLALISAGLLVAARVLGVAWWSRHATSCCDEAGWYVLDGGPLSWLCFEQGLDTTRLHTYVKQGDLEAARLVAARLIRGSTPLAGRCIFAANTRAELYVNAREREKIMQVARPRGMDVDVHVFPDSVVRKGTERSVGST